MRVLATKAPTTWLREVTYYRWAAAAPILVPIVAHLLYRDEPNIGLLDRVIIFLYLSGVALPAYIPFAIGMFWWLRGQPAERYRRVSWIAPLLFVPPLLLYLLVVRWWMGSTEPWLDVLVFYAIMSLLLGYGYVALIHVGRWVLSRR